MCASMVDIQTATAEIRRGKKKIERRRNHRAKIQWHALLHRVGIENDHAVSNRFAFGVSCLTESSHDTVVLCHIYYG